ncbi:MULTISPECIES: 5-formyltetrahydrofolate cyclo-ligase [unclassified Bosea (in: a-proteobacteria)]|uniref:5-formyltetrahydrofolate cyclo-ligase n=1 Tax=unclassified Bosea (in: a-proteobacteria) TaxID=2653178 RepID=UPI000F757E2F|nr:MULTISPECIES: 5-formyltetrahydrofolate cyclo-ligase [unclassified Bosea (in: a-proteobacteria)]AZO81073.1 5-formyltetrahydrofolate cyclo-ligase [Bosea sp. Tri-49]RXT26040.1 5-formyltetrahydrofolate cyclo-ligase [Bosea sp. Tri-39]RXT31282.1 5-formyltetrahydrofolate cyclo-ligase [Bosea sp. Tri-54]
MTDAVSRVPSPRKAALRTEALARRDALELDDRLIWDEAIVARALALPVFALGPVSAYWPMRSEADPRPILEALHERGLPLCLPAIVEKRMLFRRWAPWEPIVPGGFGTLVPSPEEPEVRPTILIVPLAAFDRRGYRIGYGKGYYDRAIAELEPVATVGIAYAAQEIEAVPAEAHDRRLDWVVTQGETIRCG